MLLWLKFLLDVSSLAIAAFQKLYNIFFWNCSSLAKNKNNFVSPNLTIHNWYCLSAVAILNPPDVKYKFQHCSMSSFYCWCTDNKVLWWNLGYILDTKSKITFFFTLSHSLFRTVQPFTYQNKLHNSKETSNHWILS